MALSPYSGPGGVCSPSASLELILVILANEMGTLKTAIMLIAMQCGCSRWGRARFCHVDTTQAANQSSVKIMAPNLCYTKTSSTKNHMLYEIEWTLSTKNTSSATYVSKFPPFDRLLSRSSTLPSPVLLVLALDIGRNSGMSLN